MVWTGWPGLFKQGGCCRGLQVICKSTKHKMGTILLTKNEIITKNNTNIPEYYVPDPFLHLGNIRDRVHFNMSLEMLNRYKIETVLDIGCYDGWLDFLLINSGYQVTGIELIEDLCEAAKRYTTAHSLNYTIYQGFFEDLDIPGTYDAILCFETLEHMPFESIPGVLKKMESLTTKAVYLSLPDQDHTLNTQHLWTPTKEVINELFKNKKNFKVDYFSYTGTTIPSNWFITYEL